MAAGKARRESEKPLIVPTGPGPCDVCGGPTFEARCKIICRRCGYTRDCSDP